jgi:hypothetical protein
MILHRTPTCQPFDVVPSGAETLTLNVSLPSGRYVIIDWGDGNKTKVVGPVSVSDYAHAYSGAGTYKIKMQGDFRRLTKMEIKTVNVDGNTNNIAALSGLTQFTCSGSNTISGDVTNLPAGLTKFTCYGSNTISGDVTNLPAGLTQFTCSGSNTISDYTTKVWTTKPATFILIPTGIGGLSAAEIDQLLIDFDDDLVWAAGNVITLTGTNAARTAASDAAVTNMVAEGVTVTTN